MRLSRAFLGVVLAAGVSPSQDAVSLLRERCQGCHNAANPAKGFDVTNRQKMIEGREVVLRRLRGEVKPAMPMGQAALSATEIEIMANWLKAGAPMESAAAAKHWAFVKPAKTPVPAVRNKAWIRNPIDAFLAAEREKKGLKPSPEADRRLLLRRVYLDLIGLPPTAAETEAFLADRSPNAYEKVVDRLLESPRYGERWGRHWMDVWRYSDWYGRRPLDDQRFSHRHVWRWRDWIVESMNADKSYDRMLREMIAGDEIAPNDPETVRATGYLVRSFHRFNRNVWLQDTVEHIGAGMLGLTFKCFRCHDHKYDPLEQIEYYRLRAFFEPHDVRLDRVPGESNLHDGGLARIFDAPPRKGGIEPYFPPIYKDTFRLIRGDETNPDKTPLSPGTPALLHPFLAKIEPVKLERETYIPDLRPFVKEDMLAAARKEIAKADAALREAKNPALAEKHLETARAALPSLEARIAADVAKFTQDSKAEDLAKSAAKAEQTYAIAQAEEATLEAQQLLKDGKAAAAKKKLDAASKALAGDAAKYTPVFEASPETSTGRRRAFAEWLTSQENPLLARVAVNHIWYRHFGKPIVRTVANFGRNGARPSNQALLDWLAVAFMESGWSTKKMHRLMVTSSAYRMMSAGPELSEANAKIDPENVTYWHMNPRRMEAEVVRDSALYLAGMLDGKMGGEDIDEKEGLKSRRRSLYIRTSPENRAEFLKLFDQPDPTECYMRPESIMPQQALALANSSLTLEAAKALSGTFNSLDDERFIAAAFQLILGLQPSRDELAESRRYLASAARESFVHALLNHNEFVTVR